MTTAQPSDTVLAVDAHLHAQRAELEGFIGELVGINSQIPPFGDERQIAGFLTDAATRLGLPGGDIVARDPHRPNVLIRSTGSGTGPRLMLNGHIDTKPVGDAGHLWNTDPLVATRIGDDIFGLGVSDMKAAIAAMLYAAAAIKACGISLTGDVLLAFVADEEAGASFGSRFLAPQLAGQVDACLIGEPSGWTKDWEGIHLISRGLCGFLVRVQGTQMHSSLTDRMPSVNANMEMARLMLALKQDYSPAPIEHPLGPLAQTLNVGVTTKGGVFYGVVPGNATFGCDLRTVPGVTEESVHAFLDTWAEHNTTVGGPTVTIEYDDVLCWIASSEISVDHALVEAACSAMTDVLGTAPPLSVFPGTTDAPWYDAVGIPTLPSLGPGILTHCHGPNEFVRAEAIHEAARIYARILLDFCGVQR